ncbi:MAG: helix-turn-helix domain-containing protein [Candidatus Nanoarchaeia archaeon]|jgi:sugar-specific transcriptional regulator TrmB
MIDLLRKLGLNKYEGDAYIALLSLGTAGAFEISKKSSVPFGRIYDSLNVLEMKGLVEVVPSKPKKYKAVEPKTALNGIVDDRLNELTIMQDEINNAVESLGQKESVDELVSVTTGRNNFAKRVAEHFDYKDEYWATSDGFKLENWYPSIKRRFAETDKQANNRFILSNFNKADPQRIKEVLKAGVNIRHYPLPGVRLLVSDEELVTISIQDPSHEWVNINIQSKALGRAMTKLLKTAWGKAKNV